MNRIIKDNIEAASILNSDNLNFYFITIYYKAVDNEIITLEFDNNAVGHVWSDKEYYGVNDSYFRDLLDNNCLKHDDKEYEFIKLVMED